MSTTTVSNGALAGSGNPCDGDGDGLDAGVTVRGFEDDEHDASSAAAPPARKLRRESADFFKAHPQA